MKSAVRFQLLAVLLCLPAFAHASEKQRPLMRDFIGLCGHTVQFKPELYAPVTRLVRDYHPMKWDFGEDTSYAPKFPFARNGVDWSKVYGSWQKAGYRAHASLMFDDLDAAAWKDLPRDAAAYGRAFGTAFGTLLEAVEIGNEPGKYDDATYRKLFEAMARGLRETAPKMQIATCAANLGTSGRYSKSVDCVAGLESLYDIVNIHNYAEIEGWPTWRRSYAEDPKIDFLKDIRAVLTWRNEHAPDKEVWLTEFGWDATTKPAPTSGDFAKWVGSTEIQQAQWTVRGFVVLAALGVDRAYLYFFNDDDTPHVHGSSGITRNFKPKPAFYALAHLQRTLSDFRFEKIIREDADGYAYQFVNDAGQRALVAWKAEAPAAPLRVELGGRRIIRAERTPLTADPAENVTVPIAAGAAIVEASELPVFLLLEN